MGGEEIAFDGEPNYDGFDDGGQASQSRCSETVPVEEARLSIVGGIGRRCYSAWPLMLPMSCHFRWRFHAIRSHRTARF